MITIRLWHQKLIPLLPRQQLLGQHRECAALRGKGWGKPHSVVNYVFKHEPERLVAYHYLIINEMQRRGYNPDRKWQNANYRGKELGVQSGWCDLNKALIYALAGSEKGIRIYPEHDEAYLQECIENLKSKGIEIVC